MVRVRVKVRVRKRVRKRVRRGESESGSKFHYQHS